MRDNNRFYLAGNLGLDPEIKACKNDVVKMILRLAVNRPKNKDGERKTDWFNISCLFKTTLDYSDKQLKFLSSVLKKGQEVVVEGHIEMNPWVSDTGDNKVSIDFVGEKVLLGRLLNVVEDSKKTSKKEASNPTYYATDTSFESLLEEEEMSDES